MTVFGGWLPTAKRGSESIVLSGPRERSRKRAGPVAATASRTNHSVATIVGRPERGLLIVSRQLSVDFDFSRRPGTGVPWHRSGDPECTLPEFFWTISVAEKGTRPARVGIRTFKRGGPVLGVPSFQRTFARNEDAPPKNRSD